MEIYKNLLRKLDNILTNVVAALFFAIFTVSILEIIARGILNFSFLWTVDLCTILASWTLLLGGAVLFHRDDHLIVDFVVNKLADSNKRIFIIISYIATLILMIILFFNGLKSASVMMNMRFTSLNWQKGYAYYALPTSAMLSILFLVEKIATQLKGDNKYE